MLILSIFMSSGTGDIVKKPKKSHLNIFFQVMLDSSVRKVIFFKVHADIFDISTELAAILPTLTP